MLRLSVQGQGICEFTVDLQRLYRWFETLSVASTMMSYAFAHVPFVNIQLLIWTAFLKVDLVNLAAIFCMIHGLSNFIKYYIYPKSRNIHSQKSMLLMIVKGWSRVHRLLKHTYPQKRDPRATDMISATSSGGWWTWFSPKSLSAPGGRCGTWWFQRTTYDIKALKHSKWSKIVHDTEYNHVTCWWRVLKIKSWYYLPGHSFFLATVWLIFWSGTKPLSSLRWAIRGLFVEL